MKQKIIVKTYPDIGEVYFIIKPKAVRISLKINKEGKPEISVPRPQDLHVGEEFLLSKTSWLLKVLSKTRFSTMNFYADTERFTVDRKFRIIHHNEEGTYTEIADTEVLLYLSQKDDIRNEQLQKFIRSVREKVLKVEAILIFSERLMQLSQQTGISYASFKVTATKSRWGSCSHDNILRLSCYLILLPSHLMDFILIHELCHVVHKNHQKEFYTLMKKIVGSQYEALEQELNHYAI